jgi:hypothetical protein
VPRVILALLLLAGAIADEIPAWVLPGIAMAESRSYWDEHGALVYVDRKVGKDHELGPFQVSPIAWRQIRKLIPGVPFSAMKDPAWCERAARLYLLWLRTLSDSWEEAVGLYNTGPWGSPAKARHYRALVIYYGKRPI